MLRVLVLGLSFQLLAVFAAFIPLLRFKETGQQAPSEHHGAAGKPDLLIFLLFSLLLFLYVGGETSISGWIATYAHRFAHLSPAQVEFVRLSILAGYRSGTRSPPLAVPIRLRIA